MYKISIIIGLIIFNIIVHIPDIKETSGVYKITTTQEKLDGVPKLKRLWPKQVLHGLIC